MKAITVFGLDEIDVNPSELVLIKKSVIEDNLECLDMSIPVEEYHKDFDRSEYDPAYRGAFGEYVVIQLRTMLDNPSKSFVEGYKEAQAGLDITSEKSFLHGIHPDSDDYSDFLDGYSFAVSEMTEKLQAAKSSAPVTAQIKVIGKEVYSGLLTTEHHKYTNALTIQFDSHEELVAALKAGTVRISINVE